MPARRASWACEVPPVSAPAADVEGGVEACLREAGPVERPPLAVGSVAQRVRRARHHAGGFEPPLQPMTAPGALLHHPPRAHGHVGVALDFRGFTDGDPFTEVDDHDPIGNVHDKPHVVLHEDHRDRQLLAAPDALWPAFGKPIPYKEDPPACESLHYAGRAARFDGGRLDVCPGKARVRGTCFAEPAARRAQPPAPAPEPDAALPAAERRRIAELGVLKALGFTHRGVLALVLAGVFVPASPVPAGALREPVQRGLEALGLSEEDTALPISERLDDPFRMSIVDSLLARPLDTPAALQMAAVEVL